MGSSKKKENMMFKSGNTKKSVNICDHTIDLKEDKDLYSQLFVLAKSNRDIDQKYAIRVTPRELFAHDGLVLPCTNKYTACKSFLNFWKLNKTLQMKGHLLHAKDCCC